MKSLLLAAALALAPVAAQAQVAAATMPNTFDRPAGPTAPQPGRPAIPPSTTPLHAGSEAAIRTFIAGARDGVIDYATMTDDVATQFRGQQATVLPLFQQFGALQAVDFVGSQNGMDLYAVVFANAATQWMIAFNDSGKIDALVFRPAE